MGWLESLRMRRAAKRYARRLKSCLRQNYGASEYYTPGQLRTAVAKLGLDARYIVLAYAPFLPEEQYRAETGGLLTELGYEEARSLYRRYVPRVLTSASGEPFASISSISGGGADGSHSGTGYLKQP